LTTRWLSRRLCRPSTRAWEWFKARLILLPAVEPPTTPADPPGPIAPQAPSRAARSAHRSPRDLLLELFIVTIGVLIALLVQSLVDWQHYRRLVREARATIAHEITDNKREIEGLITQAPGQKKKLDTALQFADQLLATKKTSVDTLDLGFNLADLSTAGWQSADQTGALGHMDYAEVQRYARAYTVQALFADRQRQSVELLAAATALLGCCDDPTKSAAPDLTAFRQQVLALKGQLLIQESIAARLVEIYDAALQGK
jgi:hypothetical protein